MANTQSILIISDDPYALEALARPLSREGVEVFTAGDTTAGTLALMIHKPHLVLLDTNKPDTDVGLLVRRIREDSDIPIIVTSAGGSIWESLKAIHVGADDYVSKPLSMAELAARVRAKLRRYDHCAV